MKWNSKMFANPTECAKRYSYGIARFTRTSTNAKNKLYQRDKIVIRPIWATLKTQVDSIDLHNYIAAQGSLSYHGEQKHIHTLHGCQEQWDINLWHLLIPGILTLGFIILPRKFTASIKSHITLQLILWWITFLQRPFTEESDLTHEVA
jgi:hypothetical protein